MELLHRQLPAERGFAAPQSPAVARSRPQSPAVARSRPRANFAPFRASKACEVATSRTRQRLTHCDPPQMGRVAVVNQMAQCLAAQCLAAQCLAAQCLAAQAETFDESAVPRDVNVLQVTQQAAALSDE